MKYSATAKISSGTTNDKIIRKLKLAEIFPRHLLIPSANATPTGTAMTVVNADSFRVWKIALCSCGLYQIELTLSPQYQRIDRPWNEDCDLPLLNENSTAITIGASDQIRYSQVKPSRKYGCRHGLRNRPGRELCAAVMGAAAATWVPLMTLPARFGSWRRRSRSSARSAPAARSSTRSRPARPRM